MGETPTVPPPSSVHAILRSIANLSNLDVKEVFQGVAIMPQISSALLNRMFGLLSDMYEDSRDVPTPLKRTSVWHSTRSKAQVGQPSIWHVTRSTAKLRNEDAVIEGLGEEDSDKRTESKGEHESPEVQHITTKIRNPPPQTLNPI